MEVGLTSLTGHRGCQCISWYEGLRAKTVRVQSKRLGFLLYCKNRWLLDRNSVSMTDCCTRNRFLLHEYDSCSMSQCCRFLTNTRNNVQHGFPWHLIYLYHNICLLLYTIQLQGHHKNQRLGRNTQASIKHHRCLASEKWRKRRLGK